MVQDMVPRLDPYCTDPARHLIMAGWDLDDLDHDLPDVCNLVKFKLPPTQKFTERGTVLLLSYGLSYEYTVFHAPAGTASIGGYYCSTDFFKFLHVGIVSIGGYY